MLSVTSQHALRALTLLARQPYGSAALGRELSESAGVPSNYLSKIMLTLRNAGLVDATRGAGGGYRLARNASELKLAEVVELFEGSTFRSECILGEGICSDAHGCSAHPLWGSVRTSYLKFLEDTSIADLAHSNHDGTK